MPRLRLRIAYQGTRYAGWQLQAHTGVPQPPTIQGELERAVVSVLDVPRIPIVGCSRTDSGVHAEDQICRLDIPAGAERIFRAIERHGDRPARDQIDAGRHLVDGDPHGDALGKTDPAEGGIDIRE